MSITIRALKNYLHTCKKAFLVHTEHTATVDFRELLDRMAQGRTTITAPDALAAIELLWMELRRALTVGEIVKLPFGSFYLCASGTFNTPDQPFVLGDKDNGHDIRLHFRANREEEVRMAMDARLERSNLYDKSAPVLVSAESATNGEAYAAERGDFMSLHGQRLKFDRLRDDLGVWYRNGSEHRALKYTTVMPGTVTAQVPPEMTPGQYLVVLRTSPNGKDIKETVLPEPVSIS